MEIDLQGSVCLSTTASLNRSPKVEFWTGNRPRKSNRSPNWRFDLAAVDVIAMQMRYRNVKCYELLFSDYSRSIYQLCI